jgi:hypothetical protein
MPRFAGVRTSATRRWLFASTGGRASQRYITPAEETTNGLGQVVPRSTRFGGSAARGRHGNATVSGDFVELSRAGSLNSLNLGSFLSQSEFAGQHNCQTNSIRDTRRSQLETVRRRELRQREGAGERPRRRQAGGGWGTGLARAASSTLHARHDSDLGVSSSRSRSVTRFGRDF